MPSVPLLRSEKSRELVLKYRSDCRIDLFDLQSDLYQVDKIIESDPTDCAVTAALLTPTYSDNGEELGFSYLLSKICQFGSVLGADVFLLALACLFTYLFVLSAAFPQVNVLFFGSILLLNFASA